MNATHTPATLLLVDDEPSILSALRRLLRPTGYTVLTATSGAEGLALLATQEVALVVSDMRMPGMDGAQFLEQVRAQWPDTVRLLLTGYADMSSTIDAINRGEIYRYIVKPWDDHELLLVIRQALEQRALRFENQRLLALTQTQNAELQTLNAGLAQTVAARTSELAQLNEFLNLANTQLRQQFLTTVKVFSSLLELRGGGVAGHARRVADLARKLAQQMNLSEAEQHHIFLAALLHDIGKIGFPDQLLNKPVSLLSTRELTEYRRHAKVGENALLPLHELKGVAHMVRSHHERHDGRGFPDGLSGEDIPVGSRVIALANDFDGLVSGTHSETHFPPEQARTQIRQARGHHYHPDVVDAFLILWDRGEWLAHDTHLTPASKLSPGMVLARDFVTEQGTLLLAAEQRLSAPIIARLQVMTRRDGSELALPIKP
ncbi:MAG: response regulator [Burkholderiaceae bacterium]|nr:response regulator [Burkholderiaceae bacterium]